MSGLDAVAPALALNLIDKYGTTCIINYKSTGAYDPTTSQNTVTSASQTMKMLIEEYADNLRFLGDKSNDQSVVQGDKKVTVPTPKLTSIPSVGDTVQIPSTGPIYIVKGVGSIYSGELVAAYVLHVSKR